jgi:hypothetical protein
MHSPSTQRSERLQHVCLRPPLHTWAVGQQNGLTPSLSGRKMKSPPFDSVPRGQQRTGSPGTWRSFGQHTCRASFSVSPSPGISREHFDGRLQHISLPGLIPLPI